MTTPEQRDAAVQAFEAQVRTERLKLECLRAQAIAELARRKYQEAEIQMHDQLSRLDTLARQAAL